MGGADLPLIFEYPIILGNDIPVLKDEDEDRCELKKPILKWFSNNVEIFVGKIENATIIKV